MPESATGEVQNPVRVAIDTELQEEVPVAVNIQADVWEPGKYGQQWHVALKPLSFVLSGKTGMYHEWAGISTHKLSKMGLMIAAFRKVFPTKDQNGETLFIGEHSYEGINAWFVRRTIKLPGKDRATGEPLQFQVWIPLKEMTDQEIEEAAKQLEVAQAAQATGGGNRQSTNGAATGATAAAPESVDLTDDDVAALLMYFQGKGTKEVQIKAGRSDLSKNAKAAVMSGYAAELLTSTDQVHVGDDGKYTLGPAGDAETDQPTEAETAGVTA